MILSPAGQLSPLKISGRFVLFLIIFAISCACCCWKSKGFRDWWIAAGGNLKKCLTTKAMERKTLKKNLERNQKKMVQNLWDLELAERFEDRLNAIEV